MTKKILVAAILASGVASTATAAPIIMEGDYVRTAVSDNGTLGYGGTTSPGIVHDATGTASWPVDDYLTPGSPFEGFYVKSDQSGSVGNNNTGSASISKTSMTDTSGVSGYDQSVNWLGGYGSLFSLETDTYYNDGDERITMTSTITALSDLTGLSFLRVLDPDPDVNTFGSYDTVNGRGNGGLAAEDWVHSEGSSTGLTIGLFTDSGLTHNTGVSESWLTDSAFYLAGNDDGNGDYTIGLAFDLGSLLADDSVSFTYSYVMGSSLDDVDLPGDNSGDIPEPASIALFGLGLAGLYTSRRKKAC